jgi:anti-anti-sigma factor
MEIERIEEGTRLRLALKGELDLYTAPAFDDALVQAEGESWPMLVIDLRELEFMDSSGLRLIVRSHARAEQSRRTVVVVNGPGVVARVFAATALDSKLNVVDDLDSVPA